MSLIRLLSFFLFLFWGSLLIAQKNFVREQHVEIDDEKIKVKYQLPIDERSFPLYINLKIKNNKISPENVLGLGYTKGRGDQEIIWLYTADDFIRVEIEQLKLKVLATRAIYPIPTKTLLATFGTASLSLLVPGTVLLINNSKTNSDYKVYMENRDEEDAIWNNLGYSSRQDLYDTVNGRYQQGQILTMSGLVVLATGAYLYWALNKKSKKIEERFSLHPMMNLGRLSHSSKPFVSVYALWRF